MQQSLRELLDKFLSESLSPEEQEVFFMMLEDSSHEGELEDLVEGYIRDRSLVGEEDEELKARSFLRLKGLLHFTEGEKNTAKVKRLGWRWSWAAAVILLAGTGTLLWFRNHPFTVKETAGLQKETGLPLAANNIAPGGNKAVLTLADGRTIILDSAADGALASQGQTQIVKTGSGELQYQGASKSKEVMMNTISTPAGGQYVVILPDGSKARLNASSSITFPATFAGKTRPVSVNGEIFFSIVKNPTQPFVVTAKNTGITVLGTSFNINAYQEESKIRTTLVEGSVMVNAGDHQLTLQPGQQAAVANNNTMIELVDHPNMEKVLAWTNGLFNFEGSDLPTVMRQLEYWYDIKVSYEGKLPPLIFKGKMYRNVNLSDVLEVLQDMGLQFRLEGKNLIVSGKGNK